jgi:glycosyltransferase involved in cell wall biosynthesis
MEHQKVHRVSVIVPTCDRPTLLGEALASIRALEGPDLSFEIIVGDNGSIPETRTVAEAHGAVYLRAERRGAGAARNVALMAATGDYLAFLDDDDVWLPGNIRTHVALLEAQPELEAAVGQVLMTESDLRPIGVPWPNDPGRGDRVVLAMLSGYYPQIGALVVRARVRDEIGLFDETLLGDQDWDWQIRIARRRKVGFVAVPSVLFRQRPAGSYDALRLRRLAFGRRVFFRHALPEWRIWGSPLRFMHAYRDVMWQYFEYFVEAAVTRAELGEREATLRAIMGAFRVFPIRTAFHLLGPRPLRKAFLSVLAPRRRPTIGPAPHLSD